MKSNQGSNQDIGTTGSGRNGNRRSGPLLYHHEAFDLAAVAT